MNKTVSTMYREMGFQSVICILFIEGWKKTNNKEIKKKSVNAKIEKETVTKNSKKKQLKKGL